MTGIATTHVGSLPRSAEVTELIFAAEAGEPVDEQRFDEVVGREVSESVARQVAAGITVVSDGEMAKISYATYIKDRTEDQAAGVTATAGSRHATRASRGDNASGREYRR